MLVDVLVYQREAREFVRASWKQGSAGVVFAVVWHLVAVGSARAAPGDMLGPPENA